MCHIDLCVSTGANVFSAVLFSLAGAMISPKFFRKITYINTLSALACHVPLAQIDIPPAVYMYVLIVLPLSHANFTKAKISSMRSKLTCQPQLARRCSAYPSKSSWDLMARKVAYRVYCAIAYCTCERQVGIAVSFHKLID